MASLGYINGTLEKITVAGTIINCLSSCGISFSKATRKSVNKDDAGWEKTLPGTKSWSMSADIEFKADATYGLPDLFAAATGNDDVALVFTTAVSGDKKYSGNAQISSLDKTSGSEETPTFSVTFEGNGALTEETES